MYNFIPVPPETVTVEKNKLLTSIELVQTIACTTQRCCNAQPAGRETCDRCRALDALKGLLT